MGLLLLPPMFRYVRCLDEALRHSSSSKCQDHWLVIEHHDSIIDASVTSYRRDRVPILAYVQSGWSQGRCLSESKRGSRKAQVTRYCTISLGLSYLQLPEVLVQYVFCLVTYGVPCGVPYDVSYLDTLFAVSENAAKAVAEWSNTRSRYQHFSPSLRHARAGCQDGKCKG
jgi:hypothetical protein